MLLNDWETKAVLLALLKVSFCSDQIDELFLATSPLQISVSSCQRRPPADEAPEASCPSPAFGQFLVFYAVITLFISGLFFSLMDVSLPPLAVCGRCKRRAAHWMPLGSTREKEMTTLIKVRTCLVSLPLHQVYKQFKNLGLLLPASQLFFRGCLLPVCRPLPTVCFSSPLCPRFNQLPVVVLKSQSGYLYRIPMCIPGG